MKKPVITITFQNGNMEKIAEVIIPNKGRPLVIQVRTSFAHADGKEHLDCSVTQYATRARRAGVVLIDCPSEYGSLRAEVISASFMSLEETQTAIQSRMKILENHLQSFYGP